MMNLKQFFFLVFFIFVFITAKSQINILPQQISNDPKLNGLFVDSLFIVNAVEGDRAGYFFINAKRDKLKELVENTIKDSIKAYIYNAERKIFKNIYEFDKQYSLFGGIAIIYFQQELNTKDYTINDDQLIFDCSYKCRLRVVGKAAGNDSIVYANLKVALSPSYLLDSQGNPNIIVNFSISGLVSRVVDYKITAHFPDWNKEGVKGEMIWGTDPPVNLTNQIKITSLDNILMPYKDLISHLYINIFNQNIVFFTPLKNGK